MIEIRNWYTNAVIHTSSKPTLRDAVEEAIALRANPRGANFGNAHPEVA